MFTLENSQIDAILRSLLLLETKLEIEQRKFFNSQQAKVTALHQQAIVKNQIKSLIKAKDISLREMVDELKEFGFEKLSD